MGARLVAIVGPLAGSVIPLTEGELPIGRQSARGLLIPDVTVSRQHCRIHCDRDGCRLVDAGSRHGTFVNGIQVRDRRLEHGDRVAIGSSLFLYLATENGPPEAGRRDQPVATSWEAKTTIELGLGGAAPLRPGSTIDGVPWPAWDLQAFLDILQPVTAERDPTTALRRLLERVAELVPAERGAVVLVDEPDRADVDLRPLVTWERDGASGPPLALPGPVARKALMHRVGLLSNDVEEQSDGAAVSPRILAVACVPVLLFDQVLGLLHLEGARPASEFTPDHLRLLAAVATVIAPALDRLRQAERQEHDRHRLEAAVHAECRMVGSSRRMQGVFAFVGRVAPTDATVLIRGESGTGKELVARAIHLNSPRSTGPFVAINCAALSETLLEAELFGHERGAFTGAIAQRRGKLEAADGGTCFLDELGDLALALQAKLLRVLQEREFERLGGNRSIRVDVRWVAATNRDLEQATRDNLFRTDLYYRLNVVSVTMPALRELPEDIPQLAEHFTAQFAARGRRPVRGISPAALLCLQRHDWPGNVRELENAIERAVVLGTEPEIMPEDLPESVLEATPGGEPGLSTYHRSVRDAKRDLVSRAIEQAGGNQTDAARQLGLHPKYFYRLVKSLGLRGGD